MPYDLVDIRNVRFRFECAKCGAAISFSLSEGGGPPSFPQLCPAGCGATWVDQRSEGFRYTNILGLLQNLANLTLVQRQQNGTTDTFRILWEVPRPDSAR